MQKMMRILCFLIIFASLTAIHALPDLIATTTCAKCVATNKVHASALTTCLTALEKDSSGSESRDLKGLGLLAIRRVKEYATEAVETTKRLVAEGDSASLQIGYCQEDFQYVVDEADDASIAFSKGESEAVSDYILSVRQHVESCKDGFEGSKHSTFNLYFERDRLNELTDVLDCITTQLFGEPST